MHWLQSKFRLAMAGLMRHKGTRLARSSSGPEHHELSHRPGLRCLDRCTGNAAKEITVDARLDYNSSEILQKFVKHLNSAAAVPRGTLPLATVNLVLTRASQINSCAVCVDMHTKDAEHAG